MKKKLIRQLSKKLTSFKEMSTGLVEKSGRKYYLLAVIILIITPVLDKGLFRVTELIAKTPIFGHYLVPFTVRAVSVFLRLMGVAVTASSGGVLAQNGAVILPQIFIKSLGWQILIMAGIAGLVWSFNTRYTPRSMFKALAAGILGSYLINILGVFIVILADVKTGSQVSEICFYLSNIVQIAFLLSFKFLSRLFFLEVKRNEGKYEASRSDSWTDEVKSSAFDNFNGHLAASSVQNRQLAPKRQARWVARLVLVMLTICSTTLFYFSHGIPLVEATNLAGPLKLDIGAGDQSFPSWGNQLDDSQSYASSSSLWPVGNSFANISSNNIFWLTNLLPTGGTDAVIPGGNYYVQFAKQGNGTIGGTAEMNVYIQLYLTSQDGTGRTILKSNTFEMRQNNADNTLMQFSIGNLVGNNITSAAKNRLGYWMMYINSTAGNPSCRTNANCYWNIAINNTNLPARLIIPGAITVPEIPKPVVFVILMVIMPVLPAIVSGRYRKRGRNIVEEFGMAWRDLMKRLLGLGDEALDELPV